MATNLLPPPALPSSLSSPLPEMAIQMCENSGQYVWQCECLSPICKCVRGCLLVCACFCVCVCEGAVIAIFSLASLPFCCLLLLYNFRIRRVNVAASGQASARIGLCMRHLPRLQPPFHLLLRLPHIEHFICQALAQRDSSWHAFK